MLAHLKCETWWKSNFFKKVCPSCRAFFRRSVQSGYNATYFCIKVWDSWVVADRVSVIFHIKDGNCEVTLKTRKNCQYCRYKWVAIFMPTLSLESLLEATLTLYEIILRLLEFWRNICGKTLMGAWCTHLKPAELVEYIENMRSTWN